MSTNINHTKQSNEGSCNYSPADLTKIFAGALKTALKSTDSILLNASEAAELVGIGKSLWYQLNSEAQIPAPIRLNKRVLWRRNELLDWADAKCPNRADWESRETNS